MDRERVVSALARALEVARKTTHLPRFLIWEPTIPPEALDELEGCLREQEELRAFDNRPLWFSALGYGVVDYRALAVWLTSRAFRLWPAQNSRSAEESVAELERFLSETSIQLFTVAVLGGIRVETPTAISDHLTLCRFDDLPYSRLKRERLSFLGTLSPRPEAALVTKEVLTRTSDDGSDRKPAFFRQDSEFSEACRMITIAGICAPAMLAMWEQTDDSIPCGDRLYQSYALWGGHPWPRRTDFVPADKALLAHTLYALYIQLPEKTRRVLRVSIDRLNLALSEPNITDSAIDLGIALEALFLAEKGPDRGEQTLTLRLRASRLLGAEPQARRAVSLLVGNVYKIRSEAVHTGTVKNPDKPIKGESKLSILSAGYSLAAEANRRVIEAGGMPDWDALLYQ